MKIAILGTHGVGKTTLSSQLFTYCIRNGKNTRLIHEVVRDCPFGLHEKQSVDTVSWIVAKQIGYELDAKARGADVIICDRSAVDPVMYLYAQVGVKVDEYAQNLSDLAHSWLNTYDVLIYVRPSDSQIIDDGFRSTDVSLQKAVDCEFSISIKDFMETFPSKQVYYLTSSSIFNADLTDFFKNMLEHNR